VSAAGVHSAGSPEGAAVPDLNLAVEGLDGGLHYLVSAKANPGTPAEDDGTYWFNPKGKNCYFTGGGAYSATCSGGTEW